MSLTLLLKEGQAHDGHGPHGGASAAPGGEAGAGSVDPAFFTGWDAALAAVSLVLLAGYGLAAWRLRRFGWGPSHRAVFAGVMGVVVALVAAASPLVVATGRGSHLAFMVQLELLMNVAPPLVLIGLSPMLDRVPSAKKGSAGRSRMPIFALGLGAWLCAMYAWHLPALHALGMGSRAAVAVQLSSFAVAGLLFWLPMVGSPRVSGRVGVVGKLVYLALAQVGAGVLAAALIWSPAELYAHGQAAGLFGLSALADQRLSGVVMMVMDMLVASTVAGWIFLKASAEPGRRGSSPAIEREALWRST